MASKRFCSVRGLGIQARLRLRRATWSTGFDLMLSQWLIHLSGPYASDQACWSEIIKLGTYLQTHHDLTFPEISTLLDLKTGRCIYDDTTRPAIRYGA